MTRSQSLEQNDFTRELTELCLKHGAGIEGGHVWEMDPGQAGPDADTRAVYAINLDGYLVRTFSPGNLAVSPDSGPKRRPGKDFSVA